VPPMVIMRHGTYARVDLTPYFSDTDGDTLAISATQTLLGGSQVAIPGGIFS
jgi:hypothetical protein